MSFKEEYEKRLRRVCGVTDDTKRVMEDSEIRYGGGCETCAHEYQVVVVTVFKGEAQTGRTEDIVLARKEFSTIGDLIIALDKVDLETENDSLDN